MKARLLLLLASVPLAGLAQIQVVQFDGTTETAVGSLYNVGSVAPGDTLLTRFRVRNTGAGAATLQTLSLAGSGFQFAAAPSLPYVIAPGSEAEFKVNFTPTTTGTFTAFLVVNSIDITLQGAASSAASLMLAGSQTPLSAGAVVDFGSVTRGGSKVQAFLLFNAASANVTVASVVVTGTAFRGPIDLTTPVHLSPGQSASFEIAFEPQSGQPAQGVLSVDGRLFNLLGMGVDPPLPSGSIVLASTQGASAQQNSVSIPLASQSQVGGSGTLTMQFQPSVPGVGDDPAVQFLSGSRRNATVSISPGDSMGKFNGQPSIAFQTGATAGTIIFTLTLPSGTQQTSLIIAPAPIVLDTASSLRKTGELDVSLTGLDNTYTASQMSFTFYDSKGAVVQPGAIPVSVASSFQQYFASTQAGGTFALLAKFPVTGDTTQIASVDIQITNAAGVTTAQKVPILGSTPPQQLPTAH
ncbi:MAG TPA: choice-of-anchor D domain-containing protein [Bryobacteraceae bacterium]|nr:choice-of-anchor D domain-containing protein [Bryobacteraceae bacterium]